MAVIDLRGSGRDFARALAGIGSGAESLIRNWRYDPTQAMFEEAIRDPNIGRPLAEAYRNSQMLSEIDGEEGPIIGENLARMGWTPELLEQVSRHYFPTVDEIANREVVRRGMIQKRLDVEEGEIESQQRYREAANRFGLPELTAGAEAASARLQTSLSDQQLEALGHYEQFIRDNGFEGIASVGQLNPTFLNYLLAHEQMDLQSQLAALGSANDAQEMAIRMARLKFDFNSEADKLVSRLRNAIENKDRTLIQPLIDQMNDLAQMQFDLFPGDTATWATGVARLIGDELKDVEFSALTRPEFIIERGAQILASGEGTIDDLMAAEGYTEEMRQVILNRARELGLEDDTLEKASQASALSKLLSWEGLEAEIAKRRRQLEELDSREYVTPGLRESIRADLWVFEMAQRFQEWARAASAEAARYGPRPVQSTSGRTF